MSSPAKSAHSAGATEILFVDARVPDQGSVVAKAGPGVDVVFIDASRGGLDQIREALAGRTDVDSIHIVSHGDAGVVLLGSSALHAGNLGGYGEQLAEIGRALTADGDIHLWGCNVGAGEAGLAFLQLMADATGADVAASDDATGGAGRGDWELEITTGEVRASQTLEVAALAEFDHELATFSVSTIGELRTALSTSASNGSADIITFIGNIGATGFGDMLNSASDGQRTFVDVNITDGQTLQIVGGGYSLDANYYGRVLEVRSGIVEISDLTVREGLISANGGNKGSAGMDALGGALYNAGTLTLTGVTVTASGAAGGGGGGGSGTYAGGGGGGGGGLAGIGGGNGGTGGTGGTNYAGNAGGGGVGGNGGDYTTPTNNRHGGGGGSTSGGAGGALAGYASGGAGATASNGTLSIGGGGGGAGYANNGGRGGNAAGAIYNSGDLTLILSTVSNNVGSAGGGGAGGVSGQNGIGGAGGLGVGGIWNAASGTLRLDSTSSGNLAANAGAGGSGGSGQGNGSAGSGYTNIYSLGALDTNYVSNNAPTATNLTQTVAYTEDPGGSVALGDIVVSDVDSGETVTATLTLSNAAAGSLSTGTFGSATSTYNAGTGVWTITGSVADVNAGLAAAAFTPAANWDQDVTIATRIRDAAGTGPADGTITLDVTAVNDALTATNLSQTVSYTEDPGGSVALGDIVVGDVDSGETVTATLTLSNAAAGSLTTGTFGSATSTYNAGTGVWTITGSVTDVNAGLAAAAFTPAANWEQDVNIATRIRDAANTGPADGTITLSVTAVNDAPTATNLTQIIAATEGGSAAALGDIVVSDVDSGETVTATLTLSAAAAGSLSTGTFGSATSTYNAGTGVWTITGSVDDVNAGLAAAAFTPSANNDQNFTITTRIRDAADTGPADGTITVNVTAVNDAPTATNLTQTVTYTEDPGGSVALGDIVVSDVDTGETVTATLTLSNAAAGSLTTGTFGSATSTYNAGTGAWTITGSVADVNAGLAAAAFTPSANNDQNFTITTRIRDAADTGPADGTITLDVTAMNDAPSATNLTQTVTYTEDPGGSVALGDIVVSDVDTGETVTATLTLSNAAAGALTTGTFGAATSTFNAGTGVWTITGSVADVNAGLAAAAFTPAANWDQNVTITTRIRDAADTGPADGTITLDVTAMNDAPSATNLTQTVTYTEDPGGSVALGDIVVSDVDTGETVTATLTLSNPAAGALTTGTFGAATSTYNAGTGVWTITGSVADVNAGLAAAAFTPAANWDQDVTITTRIRDAADTGPADGTITLNVTAVNDAPTNTVPDGQSVNEDAVLTFGSLADNAITIDDVDASESELTITLAIADGVLTLGGTAGLEVTGNGSSEVELTGTAAQINAALDGLTYAPPANANGSATLTITTSDNGNAGTGGALSDTDTVTITIDPVNDAPAGTDGSVTASENDPYVFSRADFGFTDPADAGSTAGADIFFGVRITTLPVKGPLLISGSPVMAGDVIAASALDQGLFTFVPAPDSSGSAYASFTFQVQDDGGTANGGVDLDPTANTLTINVTPDNVAPNARNDALAATEDVPVTYTAAQLLGNDTDPDGDMLTITAVSGAVNGTAVVNANGSVTFTPADNFNGVASFDYTISDGKGGADSARVTVNVAPVSDAPIMPSAGSVFIDEDTASQPIAIGASDADGEAVSYGLKSGFEPQKGTVSFAGDSFVYTPFANANGADSFTIRVTDDEGNFAEQVVSVTIAPVQDAPVATDDEVMTNPGQVLQLPVSTLLSNDFDVDGDVLKIGSVFNANGGSVSLSGSMITFTPTAGFSGTAGFDYRIYDGKGGVDTGHVTLSVTANQAPVITSPASTFTLVDLAAEVVVAAIDSDNDMLEYTAGAALHGTVSGGENGVFVYTPGSGYVGTDSFTVTVSDGRGGSIAHSVQVNVSQLPEADDWRVLAADGHIGQIGGSGAYFGTNGFQDVTVLDLAGLIVFDPSMSRGGDLIRLEGDAADWRIAQQGSSALLSDGDTHIIVPAGTGGIALAFEDGVRTLLLDTGTQSLMIGSQSLGETLATITAPANGSDLPDEGDLAASARLLLSPGGMATAGGKFDIFGSTDAEELTLLAGDFQLDPSFNRGGDEVVFGAAAPSFTAVREGSAVVLTQGESEIYIPVGLAGLDLDFAGETRTLLYDQELQAVLIGSQTIGFDVVALSEFA